MSDLTAPSTEALDCRVLLGFLARVKAGDFTARMPLDWTGVAGKVADALNDVVIADQGLEAELARVSRVVGKQGELSKRVALGHSSQSWSGGVESVNSLIELRESNEDLGRQAALLAEQNTEAEQKNREVEESKRLVDEKAGQLAVSSKYKSEFIANMSHELRTPLNSLLILAQQLEDNPDRNMTEAQVEYASVIRTSGNDLLNLLNDILDLAKVESGTVAIDAVESPIDEMAQRLLREFEHVAQNKGLEFTVDVQPGCPEHLVTDPNRLRQVLKNLLANAFKFTEQGSVRLQVGLADHGWGLGAASLNSASSVLALAVIDTGIGIDRSQQQRIFEAFSQGDGSIARLYGGTGLGLTISRELVGLLGGALTVASAPGEGSTFTVYLPLDETRRAAPPLLPPSYALPLQPPLPSRAAIVEPGPPGWTADLDRSPLPSAPGPERSWPGRVALARRPEAGSAPAAQPACDFEGAKVLVVDDDFRNIFAMTALLERGHAVVLVAEGGREALAVLGDTRDVDIVLMDIMMPVMDGYATIRAIRRLDRFKTLPIIAVTGKVIPGERQRCLDAGANEFVPKPVNIAELFGVLRPWLPGSAAGP